ncbi:nucleotidyltransferase family protein [Tenacibaculum amylolyticum]|uniref:nucleotidyltransferase family protein n=1 Tax=Tenacibaculum amylolyticum TaxID=104269 RepID=UPI003893FB87
MKIGVLILAAGTASRMGAIKQLLPYENTFLLGKVIENIQGILLKDIHVVLGANATEIKKALSNYNVTCIENPDYKNGLSTSIVCGVKRLSNYDAILICLADQPKIDSSYFQDLVALYKQNQDCIVTSKYPNKNGVPAIFPKSFYSRLLKLQGDKGAKELLNSELNFIKTITNSEKLLDIDTPEDYEKLTNS